MVNIITLYFFVVGHYRDEVLARTNGGLEETDESEVNDDDEEGIVDDSYEDVEETELQ